MHHLRVYDPFARAAFNEVLRGFLQPADAAKAGPEIRIDASENDKAYTVRAEIPGVSKDDIHVTIEGGEVTISAEVKRSHEAREGERVLRSERYEGSATRTFTFASDIDEAASEAKYENGVLTLTLAKKAPASGRKLTVQ